MAAEDEVDEKRHAHYEELRALVVKHADPRASAAALSLVIAEVIGGHFIGNDDLFFDHIRALIADYRRKFPIIT